MSSSLADLFLVDSESFSLMAVPLVEVAIVDWLLVITTTPRLLLVHSMASLHRRIVTNICLPTGILNPSLAEEEELTCIGFSSESFLTSLPFIHKDPFLMDAEPDML